jgi:hypothetical protein
MMKCRICNREFAELPTNAVQIGRRRPHSLGIFQFDGEVHHLVDMNRPPRPATSSAQAVHKRWHVGKGITKHGCIYCSPAQEIKNGIGTESI